MSDEKGFLTKVDREFLTGEREYTGENAKQQRYERREAIAARGRQAFRDFELLFDELDEQERDRVFNIGKGRADPDRLARLHDSIATTIAFLYLSLEGDVDSHAVRERSFRTPFKDVLEDGVIQGESRRHTEPLHRSMISVDFSVDVTKGMDAHALNRALEKIAEGRHGELTETEQYVVIGFFDPDVGPHEDGYAKLAENITELRAEMGIDDLQPRYQIAESDGDAGDE